MPDQTISVFRAGTFSIDPAPAWLLEVYARTDVLNDWYKAVYAVLGAAVSSATIEDRGWTDGKFKAWRTPGDGYYVELSGEEESHAEVWLPDAADWLPFTTGFVEPFLQTRAAIRQIEAIDRLANAVIAYARHGDGRHIERDTGKSRIDEDADRRAELDRYHRAKEAAALRATVQAP
jgi:hypothetical protein